MTRNEMNSFDPVAYSIQENEFLLANLGKPTIVALREAGGLNRAAVQPVLDRVNDLEAQAAHNGIPWAGVERIKQAIQTYLTQHQKWTSDRRRGRIKFPSMYAFDSRKRAHFAGPGSDNGRVRTYFNTDGTRERFEVPFFPEQFADWTPDFGSEEVSAAGKPGETSATQLHLRLNHDAENNRIECPVCMHTESYKGESRSSYSAARARMSKHLRTAKAEVDTHMELYSNEFRS